MRRKVRKHKFKLQLINKSSWIRLSIFFLLLMILTIWVWLTMIWMPQSSYTGELTPLTEKEIVIKKSLQEDVYKLATQIGVRDFTNYDQLNEAKDFLSDRFGESGYQVQLQSYEIGSKSFYNVAVEKTGTTKPEEIIIIGGHYDSVLGAGANDKGAVLLQSQKEES